MTPKCKWWLFLSLTFVFFFILFCTDPQKPDFDTPAPFSITLFSDSLGTDTLKADDTFLVGDPLFLSIKTNRLQDIVSVTINLQNLSGDTLFDSVSTTFDTTQLFIPIGFYIPQYPGIHSLSFSTITVDTTINRLFNITILGLSPELLNNKIIQRSGVPAVDLPFFMYVSATGSDTLKFSWYKNDTLISRISNDTLKFDTLASTDSGVYCCIVKNDYGTDTSINDTLHLYYLPNIIEMGTSGIPKKDSSFFIYVKATGSDTLKYQWHKNDTAVTGAINDTITFDTLYDSDDGTIYHCVVSNMVGSDISDQYTIILGNHAPQWIRDTLYGTVNEGATFTMSLPDSCTDPDNDTLTFSILAGPPVGDTITGNNIYTYSPTYDDAGQYTVTISANDNSVSSNAVLILTVINVNRKPVFVVDTPFTSYQIDEGDQLIILFKAVDPEGDPVTYQIAQNSLPRPQTTVFDTSQRTITWQSQSNDSGLYIIELHALDGIDTGNVIINIGIGDVNFPPVVSDIPDQTILEGQNFVTINLDDYVDDIDNPDNEITWNYSTTSQLTVDIISRIATIYVPDADWNSSGSIIFIAEDPGHLTDNDAATFTVTAVNDAPSFTIGSDHTVLEDASQTTVQGWAINISAGPSNESGQSLNFSCTNDNNALFSVQPTISHINGNLSYTPASNANGSAIVTVTLEDDGGTANGGVDTVTKQFTINATAVNDPPSFTKGPNVSVDEDPGASTVNNWATNISAGPSDESGQTLTFNITNNTNTLLFTVSGQPQINASGDLSYTPADNANGSATITVTLSDNGGTANGGEDTSPEQIFTITINPVNDPPEITINMNVHYPFDNPMVVNIQATFIDIDNAISQVFIKIDGGSPISCPTTSPLSYPWNVPWDENTLGSHSVEITVEDVGGESDVKTHNFYIDHNLISDTTTVWYILDRSDYDAVPVVDVTSTSGGRIVEFDVTIYPIIMLTNLIKNLTALEILECPTSTLGTIEPEIVECINLTQINFSMTGITDLPGEFSNLTLLKILDVSNNNLSASTMNLICGMTLLEDLNLTYCELTSLPASMVNLSNLTKLGIVNNYLTELPFTDIANHLPNLTKDNFFLFNNELCEPTSAWGLWLTAKFGSESEWYDIQNCP